MHTMRGLAAGRPGPGIAIVLQNPIGAPNEANMLDPQSARMLTRYNHWANKLIFDAVAKLPEGEATRERKSIFKNMVHTLNHNYVIDLIWQAHLEGREHGFTARNTPGHPPLAELWSKQKAIDDWYIAWSDGLSAAALGERVHFTLVGGNQGVMTRGEILLHVVNHTTYHRGFVGDLICQVPAQPPTTDLPVYLRENPAAGA
jgi:uncharacterized damage-inducible protein DinB